MELDIDVLDAMLNELAGDKPRIRVRAGEAITDQMLADALGVVLPEPEPKPAPVEVLRKRLNLDQLHLVPGMICPRCNGSGKSEWGTCFWCTAESKPRQSWGILSPKDILLINSRRESRRAVCDVVAA